MGKPKLIVPPGSETVNLHPIVQLLLSECGEFFVNVNETDVTKVYEQFKRVRDGEQDVVFEDLFGCPYYLTAEGVRHVISVHRAWARHVPARSDVFDIERTGELPMAALPPSD